MGGQKRRPKKRKGNILAINFKAFCVAMGVAAENVRSSIEAYVHLLDRFKKY